MAKEIQLEVLYEVDYSQKFSTGYTALSLRLRQYATLKGNNV